MCCGIDGFILGNVVFYEEKKGYSSVLATFCCRSEIVVWPVNFASVTSSDLDQKAQRVMRELVTKLCAHFQLISKAANRQTHSTQNRKEKQKKSIYS